MKFVLLNMSALVSRDIDEGTESRRGGRVMTKRSNIWGQKIWDKWLEFPVPSFTLKS
jgi:hypothetical protein